MKTKDVIAYFGSQQAVANVCEIHKSAVSQWGEIVPRLRAYQIERLTNGALTVDDSEYSKPKAGEAA